MSKPDTDYDDWEVDYDWFDDESDDDGDPFGNCGLYRDNGVYVCSQIGSEDCDFECPYSIQVGRKRWYTPRVKTP